ncbi:hypothetical protein Trydic_g21163 [Trypoxylus dichotomus]
MRARLTRTGKARTSETLCRPSDRSRLAIFSQVLSVSVLRRRKREERFKTKRDDAKEFGDIGRCSSLLKIPETVPDSENICTLMRKALAYIYRREVDEEEQAELFRML